MTENQGDEGKKKKEGEGDQDPNLQLQEKNEKGKEHDPIPYARFKEVNDKMRELETKLADFDASKTEQEKKQELERQKELKEQKKFEELAQEFQGKYETLEPEMAGATKKIEAYEAALKIVADVQMESVPELYRGVVESMPLLERISWLAENQSKLSDVKPGGIPKTPQGSSKGEITPEERRKRAKRTF